MDEPPKSARALAGVGRKGKGKGWEKGARGEFDAVGPGDMVRSASVGVGYSVTAAPHP